MSDEKTPPGPPAGPRPAGKVKRSSVMSRLTSLYADARYLEVGVNRGATFLEVPAARKVAVDPELRFDVEAARVDQPHAEFHEIPSDEYFATAVAPDEQFDVIFLDGLHVYEQTLRDLHNALHHLQPRGVIVVDDTRPPTFLASIADRRHHDTMRSRLQISDPRWMGDVFKLVWFVESFMPHLTFRTIANNHGQTVLWRKRRTDYASRSLAEIAHLTFEDLVVDEHVLQLRPFGEIRRELRGDLDL